MSTHNRSFLQHDPHASRVQFVLNELRRKHEDGERTPLPPPLEGALDLLAEEFARLREDPGTG